MMENVLVTGGTGMVGSAIKYVLTELDDGNNYYFISSKNYDLRDIKAVDKCFNERKYHKIIHLACRVGGLYKNMQNNLEMLTDNLKINLNVLECCNKYNIEKGIFCLSSCIYPEKPSKFPMEEIQLCEGSPHNSNEGYAYAKRMLYIMCKHYNNQYNRQYICLSPVNLYGFNDNFNINDGHVIPALINRMYKTKNNIYPYDLDKFEVYGSGIAQRQFLFSYDFARIILLFLYNNEITNGIFNIGESIEYTITDVITIISQILKYDENKIQYNTTYSDGILKKTISDNKFKEMYPNFLYTDFYKGLYLTLDWFQNNTDIIRE